MVNLIILVLLIVHELLKLLAEEMNFSKVKWTEIGEVWFVNQIVVDAEVEGVLARFWWVGITDPVQAALDDFNGLIGLTLP